MTNEEWKQVVNLIKDFNKAGFEHTDLGNNMFFNRDKKGKLHISIIDFEYKFWDDMNELEEIRLTAEEDGAKEKPAPKTTNSQFPFNLPSWVLPAVGVGLLAFSLLTPATLPFALATVPLVSHNIKPVVASGQNDVKPEQGISAKFLFTDEYKKYYFSVDDEERMEEYLPSGFEEETVLYRGMTLSNYEDLKNIFIDGLPGSKTINGGGKVCFTSDLKFALDYSLQYEFGYLPIIIKSIKSERNNPPKYILKFNNFSSKYISDILVWATLDGKKGWWRVSLDANGEVVLQPTDKMITVDIPTVFYTSATPAEKPLNLKTDIVKAIPVKGKYFVRVMELKDKEGNIRAYYKRVTKKEMERTKFFETLVGRFISKYPLIGVEYPKILSTSLSDLPDKVAQDIRSFNNDTSSQDIIMTTLNTSGWSQHKDSSKALIALKEKLIKNKEWEQIENFIKDLNDQGFYHTDLFGNLFFRRDGNGKLIITVIDFDNWGTENDMGDLKRIRMELESIGAKEKSPQDTPVTHNGNSSFKLPSWVLPAVGVGLLAFSLLTPATLPFALAALPLMASTVPLVTNQTNNNGISAKVLFADEYKNKNIYMPIKDVRNAEDYLPNGFMERKALYRGMEIFDLDGLKGIFGGLPGNKTKQEDHRVYFSDIVQMAMSRSMLSEEWHLPVLIKKYSDGMSKHAVSFADVEAKDIAEVLVWAVIDGKMGWWRASLDKNGEVVLQPTDNMINVDTQTISYTSAKSEQSTKKPLNLKTDIVEESPVKDKYFIRELKDKDVNIRGYYKLVKKEEIDRTKLFGTLVERFISKYPLISVEYPKILSTNIYDLPDKLAKNMISLFGNYHKDHKDMIMTVVNTYGSKDSERLSALKGKPITNEEWEQVINLFKDLNNEGFYHTDLGENIFFTRNDEGKLIVTVIDFENWNLFNEDINVLNLLKNRFEFIGAKEKSK
ncbi:MAG: hypothetical protein J6S61_00580 [Elusimicrobiaceae bacterium]|nr:hypothetical protein [Elusimicrobiaceae bacterium]